jgi:hypothetical protein
MPLRIRASARFPLEGPDWPRKLLIGGSTGLLIEFIFVGLAYLATEEAAFGIAPLVVGLNFPALGYVLQVYRATIRREAGPLPEWESWLALLRSGLAAFAVGLGYGVIPLLLLLVGLGLLVKGAVLLLLGMVLMVLGVLAGVLLLFFLPMALARYLAQNRIEVAFHPGILWNGINVVLVEYVAAYLLSVGCFLLAVLVGVLVPFLGPLAWPFLWFYLMLAVARLFGEVCAKAA